jgi:hypothetical protein
VVYLTDVWEAEQIEGRATRILDKDDGVTDLTNVIVVGERAYWVARSMPGDTGVYILFQQRSGSAPEQIDTIDLAGTLRTVHAPRNLIADGSQLVWMVGDSDIVSYDLTTGAHSVLVRGLPTSGSFTLDTSYIYWIRRTSDPAENGIKRFGWRR